MSILQWNINGFYHHLNMLQIILTEYSPKILCLQETNFNQKHTGNLKNFTCFRRDRINQNIASGGVAIYARNDVEAVPLPINSQLEAIAVKVKGIKEFNICNIYLPPDYFIDYNDLNDLINQIPCPRIITGDFNGHNIMWGSNTTNPRGRVIENIINNFNFCLLNNGSPTRFNSATGDSSIIDLTFCDPTVTTFSWEALSYTYGSDHYPIILEHCSSTTNTKFSHIPKWRIELADWEKFSEHVKNKLEQCSLYGNINQILDQFNQTITRSAEVAVGKTTYLNKRRPVPWWNKQCEEALRASKNSFYRYRRHKTTENRIEFKKLKAIATRTINASKTNSWKQFVKSINSSTPMNEVWNKVKSISGTKPLHGIPYVQVNDQYVSNAHDITEAFGRTYAEQSSDKNFTDKFLAYKKLEESKPLEIQEVGNDSINIPISKSEMENALAHMKNTAAGPDDIPVIFLKHLPPTAKDHLLAIFNIIWQQRQFPLIWKKALVIPILKPGKPKNDPASYRPISLTCAMCKLIEKIVNARLVWTLEKRNLIINEQNGFRQYRSAIDNVLDLESDINEAFATKRYCFAIFFDLQQAFDMTWKTHIINKLCSWDIGGNCLTFIRNFLQNRSLQTKVNGAISKEYILENGTPQGSILSPTLFLIAINDILNDLQKPIKARLYADDMVIFVKGQSLNSLQILLQQFLAKLEFWSEKTGFRFSTEKTQAVIFRRKNQNINDSRLYLHGQQIKLAESVKFLGLIFDRKLNWKKHIKYLVHSCNKKINLLKTLANKNWGADYHTLITLYKSLIQSKIDYGSVAYASASNATLKLLNSIHNKALRIAMGAFVTSPVESLYSESGMPSLSDRRIYMSLSYAIKIAANNQHPLYDNTFNNRYEDIFTRKPHLAKPFYQRLRNMLHAQRLIIPEVIPNRPKHPPPWTINIPACNLYLTKYDKTNHPAALITKDLSRLLQEDYSNYNKIFTDASKTEEGVGAAFICGENVSKYKLHSATTVCTAELFAIYKSLKYINNTASSKYVILTDSLSAIKAIQHLFPRTSIECLIKTEISLAQERNKDVQFIWIPSHIGIVGNEAADKSARDAIHSESAERTSNCLMSDLKSFIRLILLHNWKAKWNNSPSKLQEIKQDVLPWKPLTSSRRAQVLLTRLRLGHTRLTHEYLITGNDKPICITCNKPLSIKHILSECQSFRHQRNINSIDTDLSKILGKSCNVSNLLEFLKDINILHLL